MTRLDEITQRIANGKNAKEKFRADEKEEQKFQRRFSEEKRI